MSSGLSRSRWANPSNRTASSDYRNLKGSVSNPHLTKPVPPQSPEKKRQITQVQEYQRFLKVFRRLKWKSSFLVHSHARALTQETNNVIANVNFPIFSDTGKANAAEVMFKADFFEYYALLERALVHLLGCFGMVIHADHTTSSVPPPLSAVDLNRSVYSEAHTMQNTIIGDSRAFYGYSHRFHANVLAALDLPSNPLHPLLGTGKVRQYLGISKEFRNRWKEIEKEQGEHDNDFTGLHKSYNQILTDLNLDEMLAALLSAFEAAGGKASQYLASINVVDIDMIVDPDDDELISEFELVDEPMDWD